MNEEMIEALQEMKNSNLSSTNQYNDYAKFFQRYNKKPEDYVKNTVTFYYYMKNEKDMQPFMDRLKESFTGYLNSYYASDEKLKESFDSIIDAGDEYLDTFIDLSSNELCQRLLNIVEEKVKKDSNYLGVYNRITETIRSYNKEIEINPAFLDTLLGKGDEALNKVGIEDAIKNMNKTFENIGNVSLEKPELKEPKESLDKRVEDAKKKIDDLATSSNVNDDTSLGEIDDMAKSAMERINAMANAAMDPNLPNKEVEKEPAKVDLGQFDRATLNSSGAYEAQKRALEELARALEKENERRKARMVEEAASSYNVSTEKLEEKLGGVSLDDVDKIVFSPEMYRQAANESIAQLPKTSLNKFVKKIFDNLRLRKSDLEIGDDKALNISLDPSKAQKISNMEKKVYDKLLNHANRMKVVNRWVVNTEGNVKKAIKNVFNNLKNTNRKNKQKIASKLYSLADRINPDIGAVEEEIVEEEITHGKTR